MLVYKGIRARKANGTWFVFLDRHLYAFQDIATALNYIDSEVSK